MADPAAISTNALSTASGDTNGVFPGSDAAGQTVAAIAQAETISADEIALYDRQIRLWGVQAQEKIRTANVLLICVKALANEIAKNLVLAGIGSLTLADHEVVTGQDLGAQFFVSEEDIGKNRAEAAAPQVRKLNPRVEVNVITRDVRNEQDVNFFGAYDIIIATDLDFLTLSALNSVTRFANRPFYAGAAHGMYGFIFADLISHDFVVERQKSNVPTRLGKETDTRCIVGATTKKESGRVIEMVTKRETYSPLLLVKDSPLPPAMQRNKRDLRKVHPLLTCFRTLWDYQRERQGMYPAHSQEDLKEFTILAGEKHKELFLPAETLGAKVLYSFLRNLRSELAPVTAFLGGQLAQDVINVLGKREQPIQNLMLFDGDECVAPIYTLHPIFPNDPIVPVMTMPMPTNAAVILD